jgi:formate dehydrogenase iron-sulfur subunit
VACKQWNGLPGTRTKQTGTYQNPPDFTHDTYKLVRFTEGKKEGSREPYWYSFSDMCRHCLNPPCMAANSNNEILHDEATGAVIYTKETSKISFKEARDKCPYDVPRQSPDSKVMAKCTMCLDRVNSGLKPACVTSCPTATKIGKRESSRKLAE